MVLIFQMVKSSITTLLPSKYVTVVALKQLMRFVIAITVGTTNAKDVTVFVKELYS